AARPRSLMEERASILLSRTVWVGCLLGASATVYFLFGVLGYVHHPLLNLSVALVYLLGAIFFVANILAMLYTPWVYWGYDFVTKLIHGLFALLTGLLLYAYLSRRMNRVYGLLGCFI